MINGALSSPYYLYERPGVGPVEWTDPWGGLGQIPTSTAELQGRIQAEVAEFLAARQKLDRMRTRAMTMSAQDLDAWQNAMATQTTLEQQLPDALASAKALSEGQFNLVLGAQLAAFVARMESHLANVRALDRRFGGPKLVTTGFGWTPVLLAAGVGGLWLWSRRRR